MYLEGLSFHSIARLLGVTMFQLLIMVVRLSVFVIHVTDV